MAPEKEHCKEPRQVSGVLHCFAFRRRHPHHHDYRLCLSARCQHKAYVAAQEALRAGRLRKALRLFRRSLKLTPLMKQVFEEHAKTSYGEDVVVCGSPFEGDPQVPPQCYPGSAACTMCRPNTPSMSCRICGACLLACLLAGDEDRRGNVHQNRC